jgi:hypothetical protein
VEGSFAEWRCVHEHQDLASSLSGNLPYMIEMRCRFIAPGLKKNLEISCDAHRVRVARFPDQADILNLIVLELMTSSAEVMSRQIANSGIPP